MPSLGNNEGHEQEHPEPKVDNVGEAFVIWAEQYWGIKQAFEKPGDPNSESAPWSSIRPTFIRKINELAKNMESEKSGIEPGYYQISRGANPV